MMVLIMAALILVASILVGMVMVLISPPSKDSELGPRMNVRQFVELGAAAIHSWWRDQCIAMTKGSLTGVPILQVFIGPRSDHSLPMSVTD